MTMDATKLWIPVLGAAVIAAAVLGLRGTTAPVPEPAPIALPPQNAPEQGLPPGHPPIGAGAMPPGAGAMPAAPAAGDGPNLDWTVPARWQTVPNPNAMRLATYRVPKSGSDAEDAEMSVSRAGGSALANADRWVGQFDEAGQKTAKRSERTAGGFKTTVVEVEGTFASGSMMGGPATPKSGYALIGAIVETPGSSHFFKLTGPAATVKAARADVDALLSSLKEKK
jgi:hypothetical protein